MLSRARRRAGPVGHHQRLPARARRRGARPTPALDRFNVSVDSLQRDRFYELTRRDALGRCCAVSSRWRASPRRTRSRSTPSRSATSPRRRCCRSRGSRATPPTRSASSSSCRLTPITRGRPDQVLTGAEITRRDPCGLPARARAPRAERNRPRLPVRRRPRPDRLHQPGLRAVLRGLQSDPPDRRRPPADLPVLAQRDRPARAAARGRRRRRARADHPRRRVAQGAQAPHRRARLHPAGADDVRHRRLTRSQYVRSIIPHQ